MINKNIHYVHIKKIEKKKKKELDMEQQTGSK